MALSPPYVDVADGPSVVRDVVRALGIVAAGFLVLILLQSLTFQLLGLSSAAELRALPTVYVLVSGLPGASFVIASLGYVRLREDWSLFTVGRPSAAVALWTGAGFLALVVVNQVMSVLLAAVSSLLSELFGITVEAGENTVVTIAQSNPEVVLYLIPVTVLLVAPGEELLFRGVVQGLLRRSLGVVPAILGASLVFGSIHLLSIGSGDAWTYVVVATALGLVLGTLYEYTERLLVPIAVHALWNCSLFLYIYLQATGTSLPV